MPWYQKNRHQIPKFQKWLPWFRATMISISGKKTETQKRYFVDDWLCLNFGREKNPSAVTNIFIHRDIKVFIKKSAQKWIKCQNCKTCGLYVNFEHQFSTVFNSFCRHWITTNFKKWTVNFGKKKVFRIENLSKNFFKVSKKPKGVKIFEFYRNFESWGKIISYSQVLKMLLR